MRCCTGCCRTGGPCRGLVGGAVRADEQRLLLWEKPSATAGSAKWSLADTVLLDELTDLLNRTPSLGHVVLDEAQDLSPMQLRAVGRRCSTGAGDGPRRHRPGDDPMGQRRRGRRARRISASRTGWCRARRGFRVPASVIEFAARLLPEAAPGLAAPESVRDNPGQLDLVPVQSRELIGSTVTQVERLKELEGSIGVIVPDARVAEVSRAFTKAGLEHGTLGATHGDVDHQVDLVPATVAKGLEFDHVAGPRTGRDRGRRAGRAHRSATSLCRPDAGCLRPHRGPRDAPPGGLARVTSRLTPRRCRWGPVASFSAG